jgi:predicted NodU family carbamoyl transferase
MNILGLNAFHGDSSAALVRDGILVAAAEEERFRRLKHWAGFPSQSIAYCLREAGLSLADVDHIAVNQDSRANFLRRIHFLLTTAPNIGLVIDRVRNRRKREKISDLLIEAFPEQRFRGPSTISSTTFAICRRRFTSLPLRRRSWSPWMDLVIFRVRPGASGAAPRLRSRGGSAAIPAVTHVDGSGRLETVSRRTNPRYYRLIEAFYDLTGVPMLLNTSFNENEPVVCQPEEALDCFLRTRMDILVLGDTVISRNGS